MNSYRNPTNRNTTAARAVVQYPTDRELGISSDPEWNGFYNLLGARWADRIQKLVRS